METKEKQLAALLENPKLKVYTAAVMAQRDLLAGNFDSAIARLRVDYDKFIYAYPALGDFIKQYI